MTYAKPMLIPDLTLTFFLSLHLTFNIHFCTTDLNFDQLFFFFAVTTMGYTNYYIMLFLKNFILKPIVELILFFSNRLYLRNLVLIYIKKMAYVVYALKKYKHMHSLVTYL